MGETEDPRQALSSKDVAIRAAATRDLARCGGWDDVVSLVQHAKEDKSSAVRLYAAASAADILSRHRGLQGQKPLTTAQKAQVLDWVAGVDPGANPSLLMLLSGLGERKAVDRLGRMLRDPRYEVRGGSATGLRRMALSAAAQTNSEISSAMRDWFAHSKIPPDSILELIKLVGEAGFFNLADQARSAATAGRPHGAASEEALARLDARHQQEHWTGLWRSTGLDVLEINPNPREAGWIAIADGRLHRGGESTTAPLELKEGIASAGDLGPMRMIWAQQLGFGEDRFAAIQGAGMTWWKVEKANLPASIEQLAPTFSSEVAEAITAWLGEPEGAAAKRVLPLLHWRMGRGEEAVQFFADLTSKGRPKNDSYWWYGRILADLGRTKAACHALDTFLSKIKGKDTPWKLEATALRKALG